MVDGWGTAEGGTAVVYLPGVADIPIRFTVVRIERTGQGTPETLTNSDHVLLSLTPAKKIYRHEIEDDLWDAFRWRLQSLDGVEADDWSDPVRVPTPACSQDEVRRGLGKRLQLMRGPYAKAAGGSATAHTLAALDGSLEDEFEGWWLRASNGLVRRITASSETGTLTTGAFSTEPPEGDVMEVWRPLVNYPTLDTVEEAINNTARYLPYEETFTFSTALNTSLYTLPRVITERSIQRVELARNEYGDEPAWEQAEFYNVRRQGGELVLDLRPSRRSISYTIEQLARVTYIRVPEPFDEWNTVWRVPRDWAVTLAALQTLQQMATLVDIEDISHLTTTGAALQAEAQALTNRYRPIPAARQEFPI